MGAVELPAHAASAPASATLKAIREALKDQRRARKPTADEAFVARANAATDRAYALPLTSHEEGAKMLQLVLESEGELFDPVVRRVLARVSAVFSTTAAA